MTLYNVDIRRVVRGDQTRPHLVVAFARRKTLGFITRWARPGGTWGHTALWDDARGVFNEALMFKGVVETPQANWFRNYSAFELVAVPVPDPGAGLRFARASVGSGYDYAGALSVPFRGDWQDPNRWYCSERDTLAVQAAGLTLFFDPVRGIHPHDLWRAVRR